VSTDQPPLPDDPALLQHLLREAQAEITRLQMLIAVLLRNRFGVSVRPGACSERRANRRKFALLEPSPVAPEGGWRV
jgi:hypothetical protein